MLLVLAEQAKQQVLGLDGRASKLAGFVAGEENDAAGSFGIAFKHGSCLLRLRLLLLRDWMPPRMDTTRPDVRAPAGSRGSLAARMRDCG